jgi:DDE superfamily endonuclease
MYLARLLCVERKDVVYLDESTFNFHMRNRRTWSYNDERVSKPISNTRYSGVTLFGAIGKCLKHPVFMTAESTSSISFQLFIESLCASLKDNVDKPVLLMDNHAAHFNKSTHDLIKEYFTAVYIPAYSC